MTAPTDLREKVARFVQGGDGWEYDGDRIFDENLAAADAILALISSEREAGLQAQGGPWTYAVRYKQNAWEMIDDADEIERARADPDFTVQPLYAHPARPAQEGA